MMAVYIPGKDTSGVTWPTAWTADTTASNTSDTTFSWNDCYYEPPEPKDETAQERRRACIESFLAELHRRASFLLGRRSVGRANIRRERVWRPPRV